MKVVGFSFVRNAIKFDYPIVQAICSVLPLCEEFYIAVGKSEDDTLDLIHTIYSPKIHIIETIWDNSLREGGRVLAQQTDIALSFLPKDTTWAFYIQADEVMHEKYIPIVRAAMEKYCNTKEVEGLLFNYTHFYGSYDYIGSSRRWYKKEIRIVRPQQGLHSYKDAQGFRINNRKIRVKPINAFIYHYGWVKSPSYQQEKQKYFHSLWHNEQWIKENINTCETEFDYSKIDALTLFGATHPKYMQEKIAQQNWTFSFDPTKKHFSVKARFLNFIEKCFGWRIGEYKNYKTI
jgi:hypothetical protein